MKSIGYWTIRAPGMLLVLSLAVGCFTGQQRGGWNDNRATYYDDRGQQGAWNSERNADYDRDGGRQEQRTSEDYSEQHLKDTRRDQPQQAARAVHDQQQATHEQKNEHEQQERN